MKEEILTQKRKKEDLDQKNWQFLKNQATAVAITACSILGGLLLWQIASSQISPLFLPSPKMTLKGLYELAEDGTLVTSIIASSQRILTGWLAGVIVGIPLGMVMGYFPLIRRLFDPYIEFFRFVWHSCGDMARARRSVKGRLDFLYDRFHCDIEFPCWYACSVRIENQGFAGVRCKLYSVSRHRYSAVNYPLYDNRCENRDG